MGKAVFVLGGGIGGVVAADRLRRSLAKEHRVTVVDKSPDHIFLPSLTWVMTGQRRPHQIKRPLKSLEKKGISYINASISAIDTGAKTLTLDGAKHAYDYLVLSLGAELYPQNLPGLSDAAHVFYNLEGAVKLRDALPDFKGGHVVILISGMPYKCPAAPYEAAFLLKDYFRDRNLINKIDISILSAEPHPLPVAGPTVGQQVQTLVNQRNIATTFGIKPAAIDKNTRQVQLENGQAINFDLLIAVPPHNAPLVAKEAGLTNEAGWVPADRADLSTAHPDVYAIGDITAIKLANGMMLPKAGALAHHQAETAAAAIAAKINGTEFEEKFMGEGSCLIDLGSGKGTMAAGSFYAEPNPEVVIKTPSRVWRWGKSAYEKFWLWRWV